MQKDTAQTTIKPEQRYRVDFIAAFLSVSKNTIWRLTREGKFPKPVKLSERVTAWKGEDVLSWLESKEAA